jgi:hypothetical protein
LARQTSKDRGRFTELHICLNSPMIAKDWGRGSWVTDGLMSVQGQLAWCAVQRGTCSQLCTAHPSVSSSTLGHCPGARNCTCAHMC